MRTIFLILIILIPSIVIGQNEKTLCKSCVHKEFYWDNGFKCDEKKLRIYYEYQMNSNIVSFPKNRTVEKWTNVLNSMLEKRIILVFLPLEKRMNYD